MCRCDGSTNFAQSVNSIFFKQKTAYEMRISDWSSDVCSSDLVDHDLSLLVLLQPVDAADQRRLPRPRGSAHHDALALVDREVDVLQHVKLAKPFVQAAHLDHQLVGDADRKSTRLNSSH